MAQPLHKPTPHPSIYALGAPAFVVPHHPCGCENGYVTESEPGSATWYSPPREVWTRCPACEGYGYHELRGVENGPQWRDDYPEYGGRGGAFVARLLPAGEVTLAWAYSLEDAREWRIREDWQAGREDARLLCAMGLAGGGR